ncbi:M14 family zinc carboxypeptidase [Natrinema halophilum]|uniref:Peptidase M14 domain-containing protein n=1 Tax=Natrinema halophilum TaxID=1699371 RepID=A0A7D5GIX1_9EURY|nr:M14 family zinc carboxypeptidase [Natrinema halophilum]QLG50047.1 hypothetical protein HYG82_14870 [Natrinema halophilum]
MDGTGTGRDPATTAAAGAVYDLETPSGRATVRTTHPGGNGRVLGVDGDTIRIEPEQRDSTTRWFYWNIDVESDVAQTLRFEFPNDEVVGPRGPAVRTAMPCGGPIRNGAWDEWHWLGTADRIDVYGFRYAFDAGEQAQFSLSFPYQRSDFDAFAFEYESDPRLTVETLTTTDCGRAVPVVRLGSSDAAPAIALAARHHAYESTASYVLEGVLRELLEGAEASTLLESHRITVYPFGDVDGVERGDQGKHRGPHDHNRDYVDANAIAELSPLYRTTAAITRDLRSIESLALALDFHCPFKWGGDINDRPFFATEPAGASDAVQRLATRLESVTRARSSTDGPTLTFDASPGTGLASFDGQSGLLHTFSRYCSRRGAEPAATLEVPYVGTETDPVTPASARRFGRDLAVALERVMRVDGG